MTTRTNHYLRMVALLAATALAAILLGLVAGIQPAQGTTPLTNPGFEAGDLSGWTIRGSAGGAATVETSFTCTQFGSNCNGITVSPVEGTFFALLTAGDTDVYTTASQTFTAAAGATISGNARFLSEEETNEPENNDHAQVVIKNASTNAVVATVFSADSSTNSTPWTQWQHTFADAGDYYVEAGVKNVVDEIVPSRLALDNVVLVNPPPADTTPPTVTTTIPEDGAQKVSRTTTVMANFSEPVQNVTPQTFILERKISVKKSPTKFERVDATVTPSNDGKSAELNPALDLPKGDYRATITTEVTDQANPANALDQDSTPGKQPKVWTFTVAKLPLP